MPVGLLTTVDTRIGGSSRARAGFPGGWAGHLGRVLRFGPPPPRISYGQYDNKNRSLHGPQNHRSRRPQTAPSPSGISTRISQRKSHKPHIMLRTVQTASAALGVVCTARRALWAWGCGRMLSEAAGGPASLRAASDGEADAAVGRALALDVDALRGYGEGRYGKLGGSERREGRRRQREGRRRQRQGRRRERRGAGRPAGRRGSAGRAAEASGAGGRQSRAGWRVLRPARGHRTASGQGQGVRFVIGALG